MNLKKKKKIANEILRMNATLVFHGLNIAAEWNTRGKTNRLNAWRTANILHRWKKVLAISARPRANIDIHCNANMHWTMPSNLSTVHCMHEGDFIRIRPSPTWQSCLRERSTIPAGTRVRKSARSRLTYFNVREPIEQPFLPFNKGIIEGTQHDFVIFYKRQICCESWRC